ncbi:membrane progestin receptor alpha-B-like [Dreissena polymorpha]|uniref:Uncharacterized protein n=1 Tax=Dreissena polymorpha TaxID=45954 RepID=A0A9D4L5A8_DREPO|nr:membrane progestin receptor alpha-B-like [Dreissena polymorpha]KAH3852068.1 hypothetical protein DPMN_094564 [Dreissena polymorpha]
MVKQEKYLHVEKVPKGMRLPGITSGYRHMYLPWSYYLKSIVRLHNETVNVWSHLIGCLLLILQMIYYYDIYDRDGSSVRWTLIGHGCCCLVTLFNSAVAHLLHSKSCYVNFLVFLFDYVGVVCWGFGTSILAMYGVSDENIYHALGPNFVIIQLVWTYVTYNFICLSKVWYGHDMEIKTRKLLVVFVIVIQAMSNLLPWLPRYWNCYTSESCSMSSLNHITITCVSFTLMTLAFLFHQPEKAYPGRFDICGSSHQIFHVFVILTMSLQMRALHVDHETRANTHCQPSIYKLAAYIVALNVVCWLTILYYKRFAHRKFKQADNNNKSE